MAKVDLNWAKIREEFENTPATLQQLAEKYGVSPGTVRSRKHREGWEKKVAVEPGERSSRKAGDGTGKKEAPVGKVSKVGGAGKKKSATQRGKGQQKRATQQKKKEATLRGKSKVKRIIEDVVIENEDLTEKQRLFCLYYVKHWNAGKAAEKAGYECEKTNRFYEIGYQLLQKTPVKKEIERLKKLLFSDIYLEAQAVLQKYIDIAFADITDFVTFGQKEVPVMTMFGPLYEGEGENRKPVTKVINYVDLKESTQIDGTIIDEVSKSKDGVKIKLADRMKALEKLEKYFDLLPDKFQRQIMEEKLKLEREKLKLEEGGDEREIHIHTGIPGVDDVEESVEGSDGPGKDNGQAAQGQGDQGQGQEGDPGGGQQ